YTPPTGGTLLLYQPRLHLSTAFFIFFRLKRLRSSGSPMTFAAFIRPACQTAFLKYQTHLLLSSLFSRFFEKFFPGRKGHTHFVPWRRKRPALFLAFSAHPML
ncbi:MAG: hypothetical protein IJ713_05910, partial [Oscillibacter sp.]|nr:hypothetical protein [Oscillibacter sp.]